MNTNKAKKTRTIGELDSISEIIIYTTTRNLKKQGLKKSSKKIQ